ncbi:3-oxoacyl-[acyl-carrier-protein] reductase [Wickerhamomyces ciferrii]|uniref:3-oxoacyl-[acyl-carrier-protein] reductase n=1 Tax=Wickerhamomyces ciferrii (strain ATCC 14091 / BCRC 22168 / CBS 111 / JCM 3599 / NBRC 0793 / NRRL Y-1031 F-60-10) TaxID=1206466 RepID=K0KVD1_WICCF|nr:3-oxoacyl-[acyl-carrier-protein] reductase [Wickerhamomyces ciferrii]CCH45399.1 3-oxoacyl-[acyl-carrier-protein] reductase [Wickerhamomyces ciferrii]
MSRLDNKIVLITGAASGNGEATTREYLKKTEGKIKLILIDINENRLKDLKNEYLQKYTNLTNDDVYTSYGDLSKSEKIHEFFQKIPKSLIENLDILINNAGLARGLEKVGEIDQKDIDLMFSTNILGMITLTQLIVPIFKKNNKGDIIQLGSLAAEDPYPGGSAYCATKGAVSTFTTSLRKELINYNIRVSLIEPGIIRTNFSNTRFNGDETKVNNVYKDYEPLNADDIADLIIYITSRRENCSVSQVVILPTHQATMSDKAYR